MQTGSPVRSPWIFHDSHDLFSDFMILDLDYFSHRRPPFGVDHTTEYPRQSIHERKRESTEELEWTNHTRTSPPTLTRHVVSRQMEALQQ